MSKFFSIFKHLENSIFKFSNSHADFHSFLMGSSVLTLVEKFRNYFRYSLPHILLMMHIQFSKSYVLILSVFSKMMNVNTFDSGAYFFNVFLSMFFVSVFEKWKWITLLIALIPVGLKMYINSHLALMKFSKLISYVTNSFYANL